MVSAKEEPDLQIPPAIDGLLKVHKRIVDADRDAASGAGGSASTRLLLAATQAGSLIGKQGATIKSVQDASHCNIRVLGGGKFPLSLMATVSILLGGELSPVPFASSLFHFLFSTCSFAIICICESENATPPAGCCLTTPFENSIFVITFHLSVNIIFGSLHQTALPS